MDDLKRKALGVLRQFYGYTSFNPLQFEAIEQVMQGGDAVVLMPTGAGKSICYQVPALLSEGCAIVVSPLLALMKDQVDALLANGIPAASVNSMQTDAQNRTIVDQMFAGRIKLLYISPERLLTEIDQWSEHMRISLIAIDEAHCISQWGHDFRPEYTQLSTLKRRFPNVPIMALTATADKLTREDIQVSLGIPNAKLFLTSFDRPNIRLEVVQNVSGKSKLAMIARFIDRHKGESGIIYCLSRKSVETLADKLCQLGYNARPFHAGMSVDEKNGTMHSFLNDDVPIVCATVAFGMGINKSNVRWVIHYNMPKNLECYYQEIGRAGRDGLPAEALMFYSVGDVITLSSFAQDSGQSKLNEEKLRRMQQFAESSVCRRRILLSYFNEKFVRDCDNCDVCSNPPERFDGTVLCQMALSAMVRTGEKVGFTTLIDVLRGSRKADVVAKGYDKIKTYGVGHELSFAMWNAYLLQMLQLGVIELAYNEDNHLKVTEFGREILMGNRTVELSKFEPRQRERKKPTFQLELPQQPSLLQELKDLRKALATANGVRPYMVFSDKVLDIMAREMPVTKAQFATLYGVAERKTELYWRPFTEVIKKFKEENG